MKKLAAFLMKPKSEQKSVPPQQADITSNALYSMTLLEHWDLEMHNACARGLKKAFNYLEDHISPAHGKLLFQTSGLITEVDQLIKLIEDDSISTLDFTRMQSLHSLAYAILKVLSRHEALIPSDLYDELTSSNVDYENLLLQPRNQYLGLLEYIMNSLWRLVYEKQCGVSLDQVCKTIGVVLLRPPDEGMISFEEDMFQTPEMQLRLAAFSGILRCFRVDPIHSQSPAKPCATNTSVSQPATSAASVQDRSVKLIFLDPENRPNETQLMDVLSNYGEVANIGFKGKFAVVLFAELESALESALDNDGHGLGNDIKVKYLGSKDLLDAHMKHLEEMYNPSVQQLSSGAGRSNANESNRQLEEELIAPVQTTLPVEISAIHPYTGRSMADAGDHNLSLNLSSDYRHGKHGLDGYSSSSSNGSQHDSRRKSHSVGASTNTGGWKTAQRSNSREAMSSPTAESLGEQMPRPHTAPTSSHMTKAENRYGGIAYEDASPSSNSTSRRGSEHRSQSPLHVQIGEPHEEMNSDVEEDGKRVNYSTLVSPPSSGGSLKRQRQIKKIKVGLSPTSTTSSAHASPYQGNLHVSNDHPIEEEVSILEEYASPHLIRKSGRDHESEDAEVLISTREIPVGQFSNSSPHESQDEYGAQSRTRSHSNSSAGSHSGAGSRRGSLLHTEQNKTELRPKKSQVDPPTANEGDIISYFARKIAQSIDRTNTQHEAARSQSNPLPALSQEYTCVKALFEVAEREYQDQITALEAKCIVYQDKIHQQDTWLTAIEQRWKAELLQKQIHVTTLETDNRQLREEIQGLKMEIQSKNARIVALETSSETLQRAAQMCKDRAQRDSLSVVLSQQQVIASLDENMEAIKSQNIRLQNEIDAMTLNHSSMINETIQWKSKVAEWELKWEGLQSELTERQLRQEPPSKEEKEREDSEGKNGKYFEGILVSAGKQSILDSGATSEDKEYRTMRAIADYEIDEYMKHLPGRYHPFYSKDTVGFIRAETRSPHRADSDNPPDQDKTNSDAFHSKSSPGKPLIVKFDDQTANMTYSERLLANMTNHYRAGYRQSSAGDNLNQRKSSSPTQKQSRSSYHPYYQNQPSRSAAITAAHMLPSSTEVPLPERPTPYVSAKVPGSSSAVASVRPPISGTVAPISSGLLASAILDSPSSFSQRDTTSMSPSALRSSTNNRPSSLSYDDPMTAIRNYLAEKQLATARADQGNELQGMRFYNHFRAQFEHLEIKPTPINHGSSFPISATSTIPPHYGNDRSRTTSGINSVLKNDDLWKLYA